jgi:hypothetical protein
MGNLGMFMFRNSGGAADETRPLVARCSNDASRAHVGA